MIYCQRKDCACQSEIKGTCCRPNAHIDADCKCESYESDIEKVSEKEWKAQLGKSCLKNYEANAGRPGNPFNETGNIGKMPAKPGGVQ